MRLQKLLTSKQALESEVRKLKLQLNEERAARQNGVTNHHDQEYENEREFLSLIWQLAGHLNTGVRC